ncbi:MAG TPA: sigma-70 family RNA polymerase sigma factor [Candidatus Binataceae bacterium]|nr:sigma-70 family RNA polymerase sigma factor [Candidatus Binataceae bacterium]
MADATRKTPSDAELIAGMAAEDAESFRALSARYSGVLTALSRRIVGNETDAEDVVAEALWRAWRAAKDFDPSRGSAAAWLITIARSRAIDHLRARKSADRPHPYNPGPETAESPSAGLILSQRAHVVRAALNELDERERTALQMAYYSDFSQTEIAERLGLPLGTVKTRIRAAMIKLRKTLAEQQL